MNCFGESIKLSTISDDSFRPYHRRFRISQHNDDHVIISESANLVSKYDMSVKPMVALQSWSFEELNRLIVPAVLDDSCHPNHMVAVHSCNTLIEWNVHNDDNGKQLTQIFKKNFSLEIIDLLLPNGKQSDILIVFSNGWITSLKQVKTDYFSEEDSQNVIDENEKIQEIEMKTTKRRTMIHYRTLDRNELNMYIYRLDIKNDRIESSKKSQIKGHYDTFGFDGYRLLGAIKHDDCIKVYELMTENQIHQFELPSFDTLCSMAICKSGAYGFIGRRSNGQFVVEVYECTYCIRIGSLNLDLGDVFFQRFCALDDTLVVTSVNNILFLPISNQKPLLSQLLTKGLSETCIDGPTNQIRMTNNSQFRERLGILNFSIDEDDNHTITLERISQMNTNFDVIARQHQGLPEEIIAQVLYFCTKQHLGLSATMTADSDDRRLQQIRDLFEKLVKLPFNETFMISCLKSCRITAPQSLLAIEWILDLLPSDNCYLLSWVSVLLDANYHQFIVRPNSQVLLTLEQIRQRIDDNIDFYQQLSSVESLIELISKKDHSLWKAINVDSSENIGDYCIELLTIP
ncbi:hypothetical protein BLA29_002010 [Euroglyphus maynei]|uniref:Nucleolar protein 11 N-terminal domain-containing protein n=1 Tax=Euroglyphus maynei TaxID=6958 RepID=A0A1Y3BVS5_EURMA|nr:hypothetical protein BLA29_002010 [Euroglyphus maynei]